MTRVTVGVERLRTLTAQWQWVTSIGRYLQPFTGNGNISIWVKDSRVGRKTPKQKKHHFETTATKRSFVWKNLVIYLRVEIILRLSMEVRFSWLSKKLKIEKKIWFLLRSLIFCNHLIDHPIQKKMTNILRCTRAELCIYISDWPKTPERLILEAISYITFSIYHMHLYYSLLCLRLGGNFMCI